MKKILSALVAVMLLLTAATAAHATSFTNFKIARQIPGTEPVQGPAVHTPWGAALVSRDYQAIFTSDESSDSQSFGLQWKANNGTSGMCVDSRGSGAPWYGKCSFANLPLNSIIKARGGRCNGSDENCNVVENWQWYTGFETVIVP